MYIKRLRQHINKTEVRFVIATLVITVSVAGLSAYYHLTWRSGFALALGMFIILSIFAFLRRDIFLQKLLIFGIAAGIVELMADCWLVRSTGTLVYPNNEPMIACSPLYMPFAWAVILVQIGYLGWLISNKEKMWMSMLCSLVIGLAVIPLFEHWAKGADWWYYQNCKIIYNTPWYIILGEGLICSMLPLFFKHIHRKKHALQVALGIIEGLWIWVSYFIAIHITD
ncbi:MAG: hypothetical protein JST21_13840 [Bacteroidetes bacterium]|nr:hypothetical protein [Bacteroidota bacterium]